jgi:hypothetical protein
MGSKNGYCNKSSIKLVMKNNPEAQILTELKLDHLIGKWTVSSVGK